MNTTLFSFNYLYKFSENLKKIVDKAIEEHQPVRIRCRKGKDFIVMSAEDWEQEQETLYVLRNKSLMDQIAASQVTFDKGSGYQPIREQPGAIDPI